MTRKRYVKLCMALGMSRNAANRMADRCRAAGIPYAVNYRTRAPWIRLGQAARRASAYMLNLSKSLSGLKPLCKELQDLLVVHHTQPITPDNLTPGNIHIVTKQEHDALHGYSAKVNYVDENHPIRRADALDALRYSVQVAQEVAKNE